MDKEIFLKFKKQDDCVEAIASKIKKLPENVVSGVEKLINEVAALEEEKTKLQKLLDQEQRP